MLPIDKLEDLRARFAEVEEMICRPEIISDSRRYTSLMKERADRSDLVESYAKYCKLEQDLADNREMLNDPELRELAEEEIPDLVKGMEVLQSKIQLLLLPQDPNDERNTILEIRSGAGGQEAALFAADLFRMYSRFADSNKWKLELLSVSDAAAGGIKEVIALITGDKVFSKMRFEAGVHRVQRVPATESQGRIHTSTATVAVLPEVDEVDEIDVKKEDLEITVTAAGGAGGQKVNTTNSAVQLKHLPSGIIVRCEAERSQHQNRARAMQLLKSKLLEIEVKKQADELAGERRDMVGTGDRSEKIRTYNYPQTRITDHRIQLTVHNLGEVMDGAVDELMTALRTHHQAAQLEAQNND
jgi:peptide chain release factor 1